MSFESSFESIDPDELSAVNGGLGPILSAVFGGALQGVGSAISSGQLGHGGVWKGLLNGGLQGLFSSLQGLINNAGQGGQPQGGQPQGSQPQQGQPQPQAS